MATAHPMNREDCILFSGGAPGAEAEFGANAERLGIEEVNFGFEGHTHVRARGLRILNHEELKSGDVSLAYISKLLNRRYTDSPTLRKVLQSIWYQINSGQEIFVVGNILDDNTVKGGTGWGAEFAKLCNKPLYVFDQAAAAVVHLEPAGLGHLRPPGRSLIRHPHFTGTGTRYLEESGKRAIAELFERSVQVESRSGRDVPVLNRPFPGHSENIRASGASPFRRRPAGRSTPPGTTASSVRRSTPAA